MLAHGCKTLFYFFNFLLLFRKYCYFQSSKKIESIQKCSTRLLVLNDYESDYGNLLKKNTTIIEIKILHTLIILIRVS